MSDLSTLLNKINTTVDQKIKEEELKEQSTNEERENYVKQIKGMSERITDMLTLVNTLCERKIPKSEYTYQLFHDFTEELSKNNCPISFANGTQKRYTDPPYNMVTLDFKSSTTSCNFRIYVSTSEIKYYALWSSGSMSEYSIADLKPNRFYEFIVEFERAEQILKQFIINL